MKSHFEHTLPSAFRARTEIGTGYLLLTSSSPIRPVIYFQDWRKVAMTTTVLNYPATDGKLQVN